MAYIYQRYDIKNNRSHLKNRIASICVIPGNTVEKYMIMAQEMGFFKLMLCLKGERYGLSSNDRPLWSGLLQLSLLFSPQGRGINEPG